MISYKLALLLAMQLPLWQADSGTGYPDMPKGHADGRWTGPGYDPLWKRHQKIDSWLLDVSNAPLDLRGRTVPQAQRLVALIMLGYIKNWKFPILEKWIASDLKEHGPYLLLHQRYQYDGQLGFVIYHR